MIYFVSITKAFNDKNHDNDKNISFKHTQTNTQHDMIINKASYRLTSHYMVCEVSTDSIVYSSIELYSIIKRNIHLHMADEEKQISLTFDIVWINIEYG